MQKIIEILNKPWLCTKDIEELCHCSTNRATALKTYVQNELKKNGKTILNKKFVSTSAFVHFLNEETITVTYNLILENLTKEIKSK